MIVMKFGGTSVADATALVALRTAVAQEGAARVVVVSAMAGVTDHLVEIATQAEAGNHDAVAVRLQLLLERHLTTAHELGLAEHPTLADDLRAELTRLADNLATSSGLIEGWRDAVLGTGELLSSRVVVAVLQSVGLPAVWCDARDVIRTDGRFGGAFPDREAIAELAQAVISPLLMTGQLPVTQGFIGSTAAGRPTVLGRGGSDFSAALLGAALGAEHVEIWTDVSGLMTADPRIVPEARVLSEATYDEAAELAAFGAKVLHPATQLPLVEARIPIIIRNTFQPDAPGTRIVGEAQVEDDLPVRSISFKRGVVVLQIRAARMLGAFGFLRRIFGVFERHEIVVDVLATSEVSVSLTVDPSPRLDAVIADLGLIGEVTRRDHRGIIAVVGRAIRDTPGITARVYQAIPNVNIEMISQGASASNLTFIVREEQGPETIRALHRTFFGGPL